MQVTVREPDRMSLPGLIAAGILERRLGGETRVALRGDVVLEVAGARVTLRFGDAGVEVTREPAVDPIAEIHGNYGAFVDLASGRPLRSFRGGMRVRGAPGILLQLLPLLRARR